MSQFSKLAITIRYVVRGIKNEIVALFTHDLVDSDWGHRVIDQVLRKGRFDHDHHHTDLSI
jgi:hypothetical protein